MMANPIFGGVCRLMEATLVEIEILGRFKNATVQTIVVLSGLWRRLV
jgi:hypothetical protein